MKTLIIKKIWTSVALILMLAPVFIFTDTALSQSNYNFIDNSGVKQTADSAGFETVASVSSVDDIIATIIYIILGFLGVIFLALMLFGGFNWMTSNGNEEKVNKAKETLLNALIGLLITLAAFAISFFLINYFS